MVLPLTCQSIPYQESLCPSNLFRRNIISFRDWTDQGITFPTKLKLLAKVFFFFFFFFFVKSNASDCFRKVSIICINWMNCQLLVQIKQIVMAKKNKLTVEIK